MTQVNEVGWGPLKDELTQSQYVLRNVERLQEELHSAKQAMSMSLQKLNLNRKKRVLSLLQSENRGVCLLHKEIFRKSRVKDSVVSKEGLSLVRMVKSWTVGYRVGDSDTDYQTESREYDSVACVQCQSVVSHGNFSDSEHAIHTLSRSHAPQAEYVEELYSEEILDMVSDVCYNMPAVSSLNLSSL